LSIFAEARVINNISTDAWYSGICVSRVDGRHNRMHTVRMLTVDSTLLPAIMDQIFVENRDFYIPPTLDAAVNFNNFSRQEYNQRRKCCHWKGGGGVAQF